MDKLIALQSHLINKSSSTNNLIIPSNDGEEEQGEKREGERSCNYESVLQNSYQSLSVFRDDTLEKWSNKLQLATGKLTMKVIAA